MTYLHNSLFCVLDDLLPDVASLKRLFLTMGSQFKLAKSTVEEAWQFATTSPDTQSYLANEGITWSFIIELAPWMGGFYERLVGLVKQARQD